MSKKTEAQIRFSADVSGLKDGLSQTNKDLKLLRNELKLNKTQLKGNSESTELLEKRQDLLSKEYEEATKKVELNEQALEKAKQILGESSSEYQKFANEVLSAKNVQAGIQNELNDTKKKLEEQADAADDAGDAIDDVSNDAANSQGGFTIMKGAIADLVSNGIQWCIGKVVELGNHFKELPDSTREFRQDLSTLDTSFKRNGFSAAQAEKTYKKLYKVFGEDDRAVETANNISKMAKNQKDLNKWTRITTGIWGTYQDALPVESLAEASNETAKTGQVTGALADALNWNSDAAKMFSKYMNEDVTTAEDAFNVALSKCTNEQQRQKLITKTLTKLYGGAADQYRDTAKSQMEAKGAAADHALAEAELAEKLEPVTTEFQRLKTEILTQAAPAIVDIANKIQDATNWVVEHKEALSNLAIGIGVFAGSFLLISNAAAIIGGITAAFTLLTSAVFWIPVAIAAVITAVVLLIKNWDKVKAKAIELKNAVVAKFKELKDKAVGAIIALKDKVVAKFVEIKDKVVDKVVSLKDKAVDKFNELKDKAVDKIRGIKDKAGEIVDGIKDKFKAGIDKVKGFFTGLKLKLPKPEMPKLPHFSLKTSTKTVFGKEIKYPSGINVEWRAKGAIFKKPTLLQSTRGLQGVGEAGAEAVAPISKLREYIREEYQTMVPNNSIDYKKLARVVIEGVRNSDSKIVISKREFARLVKEVG